MKKKRSSRGRRITTIVLLLILLVGLGLILYPSFSDLWNNLHQTRAVVNYAETVADLDNEVYEQMYSEAVAYNARLLRTGIRWSMTDEEREEYTSTLDVSNTGMMSYIEIPKINCTLPVYHGTDETALQIAIGHLEGSSLPVGGEGTHCVLSGHRGLPSARLFTDLDKLVEGDDFLLYTLDDVLTYEVDQIRVVLPTDVSDLNIEAGKDYCTLVTCTPYGINTHRLLVRGHRVETETVSHVRVTADATQIDNVIVAPFVAVPMLLILLILLLLFTGKGKSRPETVENGESENNDDKEE